MNSDRENSNRTYRNHYADFDEHGNRRTNRMVDDRASSGDSINRDSQRNDNSPRGSNYTRAYGDYNNGTHYGEGGSTYGGGSAYGYTNYGPNRDHGPHKAARGRNQSEHVRNGYGDYTDYDSRNYGSFAGSRDYSDYMYYNYGPASRSERFTHGSDYNPRGRGSNSFPYIDCDDRNR